MRNLKKVIALVAVFAMMVTSVAFAQSYSDVKEDDNYYEAIEMLSKLNILTGDDKDGDGVMDFRPNDTITRAEVAAVVCRIQNLNGLSQTATPFTDVPSSHWASGYVAQAAGQGIINGYGDGNFGPEDEVTYEQAVKMFVETLGYTPFVNANGGYPTGHLTAAARYGVLDGVVGASVGAQATRGQVAQMAFNAIDTPLMDRSSYGKDEEFTIFDGTNNKSFETLLTRDLKVKKFAGVISGDQVTTLTASKSIDTDKKAEVDVKWDGSYNASGDLTSYSTDNANYAVKDITKLYEAESGAGQLLGYFVDGYAKETDRSGEYDIIAVTASNKNKTESFSLDKYSTVDGTKIEYYKNENDSKTTSLTVEEGAAVIYNGAFYKKVGANDLKATLEELNVIKDCKYSGQITLIDNDTTNGYDVVKVDVASSAVVKEVKSNGKVTFKEVPYNSLKSSKDKIELDFDEDVTDTIINLTKDGKAMDYTDLKEWDVLSILRSAGNTTKYYDVKVLGANKIDGTIDSRSASTTSADGKKYTIAGNTYKVAVGCYGADTDKGWSVGKAGVFYVDDYGKIVAYDKNGSTTSSASNGNYAYAIQAKYVSNGFDPVLTLQVLDKSGKVVELDFSDKVKFENADKTTFENYFTGFDPDSSYDPSDAKNQVSFAGVFANKLITYDTNSQGKIKTVTFSQTDEDENTLCVNDVSAGYIYNEEDKEITLNSTYSVDDSTVVFFVKGKTDLTVTAGTKTYTVAGDVSTTASKVGTVASIADTDKKKVNSKYVAAVYDADNDVAGAIVLFNTTGGISDSTSSAVIAEAPGQTQIDGSNTLSVTYYKDGVKMTSALDTDVAEGSLKTAQPGDIYKFSLNGDGTIITDFSLVASFDARSTTAAGAAGALKAKTITNAKLVKFGPVYDYANSKLKIASKDGSGNYIFAAPYDDINASEANVYVYDMNKRDNKLTAGDASDADYDKDLFDKDSKTDKFTGVVNNGSKEQIVADDEQALGLMDFAVGVYKSETDSKAIDVVIYKAYDFGKYDVVTK